MVVLPADHFIADEAAFRGILERAIRTAEQGWLTTIGVRPTRAETGYGYIELGNALHEGRTRSRISWRSPIARGPEGLLAGGRHLWNAGMFVFRARVMLQSVGRHLPALFTGLAALDAAAERGDEARALEEVFPSLPSISIDHGVMEKADRVAVVPGAFGWNDVGSWEVSWELARRDADGNALPEGAVAIDAVNNLVKDLSSGKKRRFALLGVSDLVLVETDDAVLVMPRSRAQDVRTVVEEMVRRGGGEEL